MKGGLDLSSRTLVVSLHDLNYTPNAKSDSSYSASISPSLITVSGYADGLLATQTVAITSGSYVTWDAADLTLSAAATMKAKWCVIRPQSGSDIPVCYFDTETTQTTGVEVTQLVIQWNALGIAQINNPSA